MSRVVRPPGAVGNGHHWDARTPTYPGTFDGYQVHSHHYRDPFEPYDFRGKRVMIVGAGNSAMGHLPRAVGSGRSPSSCSSRCATACGCRRSTSTASPPTRRRCRRAMPAKVGRALARRRPQTPSATWRTTGCPSPTPSARCASVGVRRVPHPCRLRRHHPRGVRSTASTATAAGGVHRRLTRAGRRHRAGDRLNVTFPFFRQPELSRPRTTRSRCSSGWRNPVSRTCSSSGSPNRCRALVKQLRRAAVEARDRSDRGHVCVPAGERDARGDRGRREG